MSIRTVLRGVQRCTWWLVPRMRIMNATFYNYHPNQLVTMLHCDVIPVSIGLNIQPVENHACQWNLLRWYGHFLAVVNFLVRLSIGWRN